MALEVVREKVFQRFHDGAAWLMGHSSRLDVPSLHPDLRTQPLGSSPLQSCRTRSP